MYLNAKQNYETTKELKIRLYVSDSSPLDATFCISKAPSNPLFFVKITSNETISDIFVCTSPSAEQMHLSRSNIIANLGQRKHKPGVHASPENTRNRLVASHPATSRETFEISALERVLFT